jgi:hypothetical protein
MLDPQDELSDELSLIKARLDRLERSRPRGDDAWLNETEASRYIGKNDQYLRRLRIEGKGPPWTQNGRQIMRKRSVLDRFMTDPDSFA